MKLRNRSRLEKKIDTLSTVRLIWKPLSRSLKRFSDPCAEEMTKSESILLEYSIQVRETAPNLHAIRRIHLYKSIVSDNIAYRADRAKRREIDSYNNDAGATLVFSSLVKDISAGDSSFNDSEVTFYNMLDGTVALNIAEIDFGSYSSGLAGETYTLPNQITGVKSVTDNSAYSNAGVIVGIDSDDNFYYQGGNESWYNFANEQISDRPDDLTIITGRDIYGNVDAENPDIGPVIMPASE